MFTALKSLRKKIELLNDAIEESRGSQQRKRSNRKLEIDMYFVESI